MAVKLYQPSGEYRPIVFVYAFIAAIPVFFGAFVYAGIGVYIPLWGITTVVAIFGYAVFTGVLIRQVLERSHTRSPLIVRALSLVMGMGATWAAWVAFLSLLSSREELGLSTMDLVRSPAMMFEIAALLAREGYITIKHVTPTGLALWSAWGIEALLLMGGIYVFGAGALDDSYCERCGAWMVPTAPELLAVNPGVIADQIRTGDAANITNCQLAFSEASDRDQIKVLGCPSCTARSLSVEHVVTRIDARGRKNETTTPLLRNALVDAGFVTRMMAALDRKPA